MSPSCSQNDAARVSQRKGRVRAAQVGLLYDNANTGLAVTVIAVPILGYFQSLAVRPRIAVGWSLYMLIVARPIHFDSQITWAQLARLRTCQWLTVFAVGAGLAGSGWGAAGILLYPEAKLMSQVFLVLVLGGMMLGGRTAIGGAAEAFLAFLIPTGILPGVRLVIRRRQGTHRPPWGCWLRCSLLRY